MDKLVQTSTGSNNGCHEKVVENKLSLYHTGVLFGDSGEMDKSDGSQNNLGKFWNAC